MENKEKVIITKDQYDEIMKALSDYNKMLENRPKEIAAMMGLHNAVRMETATDIFSKLLKILELKKGIVISNYGVAESVGADVAIRTVKELAKQYGVEIKE